jgi:hypothetical protein
VPHQLLVRRAEAEPYRQSRRQLRRRLHRFRPSFPRCDGRGDGVKGMTWAALGCLFSFLLCGNLRLCLFPLLNFNPCHIECLEVLNIN